MHTGRQDWWRMNLARSKAETRSSPWNLIFCTTCWCLWNWRNNHILDNGTYIPVNKCGVIKSLAEDFQRAWSPSPSNQGPLMQEIFVSWSKPLGGWVKINVDGSCDRSSGYIGAGGAIRDHNGSWKVGFIHSIGKGRSFLA